MSGQVGSFRKPCANFEYFSKLWFSMADLLKSRFVIICNHLEAMMSHYGGFSGSLFNSWKPAWGVILGYVGALLQSILGTVRAPVGCLGGKRWILGSNSQLERVRRHQSHSRKGSGSQTWPNMLQHGANLGPIWACLQASKGPSWSYGWR